MTRRALTRLTLVLAYSGTVAFLAASVLNLFVLDFVCFDECPPENELAAALAHRLTWYWGCWLPGILALVIAWFLSLAQLGRTQRWGRFLMVVLAPFVGIGLAGVVALWVGGGQLLPTTWAVFASWRESKDLVLLPLLLGPLTTIVVCHTLHEPGASVATVTTRE
jgi:hypothetical protein